MDTNYHHAIAWLVENGDDIRAAEKVLYFQLIEEGTTLAASAYGTVFYMTTGFHALHVTGGLFAFVYLLIRTSLTKFTPQQATAAIVVSYYWHFVDIVWIGLFTVIYFIR